MQLLCGKHYLCTPMKISPVRSFILVLLSGLVLLGCKSEFERVRTSNDPERMLAKANAYYDEGDWDRAQILYELVINNYRGRGEAEEVYFKYAYTHYNMQQYILSSHYFRNFANTFINSPDREEAEFMSSYSQYMLSPNFRLDQGATEKAIEGFQLFVNTYPNSPRVEQCNQLIDEMRVKLEKKAFQQGQLYYDMGNYESAMHTFENVLKDFPESKRAELIRYRIVESSFLLAENSIYEKKEDRFKETLEKAARFLKRYEKSPYNRDVRKIIEDSESKIKELEYE